MTTLATPWGYFRYHSLPFGFSCAPSVFQKRMDKLLGGVEGVLVFMDDILVATPDLDSHFIVLERVFKIFRKI